MLQQQQQQMLLLALPRRCAFLLAVVLPVVIIPRSHMVSSFSVVLPTGHRSVHSTVSQVRVSPFLVAPHFMASTGSDNDSDSSVKETTFARMTGPKLFKTVANWEGIHAVPLVPLRIFTGLLMIHHGSEGGLGPANFGTPEFQGFVDYIVVPYFGFLPGPPELWSAVHDCVEFYGGLCLTVGLLTRPAALALLGTMMGAVYFHLSATGFQGFPLGHVPNYSYDFEEPTLYALICLVFWFNGAGPLSVDSLIYTKVLKKND